MSRRDLLHHELGQRGHTVVRGVLAEALSQEALEGLRLLSQPQRDADEVAGMFHGAADDLVPVLGGKEVLGRRAAR